MLLDTSAVVAVIMAEHSSQALVDVMADAPTIKIGAPSLVEVAMVLDGRRAESSLEASARLALLMSRFEIGVLPFEQRHWPVAWASFLRFGKGRHPAALNFGDCLTYAIARLSGLPLLCVGDDFSHTDLDLVPLPA